MLTLGQAARLTGLGKTTVTRAIKSGKLSATRREDGSYAIDPAELSRVYEVRPETLETGGGEGAAVRHATPAETARDGAETAPDLAVRFAALEAEVRGLRDLLAEVREARDEWKSQAVRLVNSLPAPAATGATGETVARPSRPWWRRLAG